MLGNAISGPFSQLTTVYNLYKVVDSQHWKPSGGSPINVNHRTASK